MLDETVAYYPVVMRLSRPGLYSAPLPQGFRLERWAPGREGDWAAIQCAANNGAAREKMEAVFEREFAPEPELLARRMLLAYGPGGEPAATAALWHGADLGSDMARVHWVATAPPFEGRGLCTALMASLMDIYRAEGCAGGIYLTTQTTSWPAIGIYKRFGFRPEMRPGDETAWALIDEKLAQRRR